MPKYKIMRCPFPNCTAIWSPRSEIVISCSKCKRRFDYPGKEVEPERSEVEFSGYAQLKKWLQEANKISKQSESLEEILKGTYARKKGSE